MPTIVRGAVLRMTLPAKVMGETGFIDASKAYNRLSDEMKARIGDLEVVYKFNPDFCSGQFGFPEDIRRLEIGKAPVVNTNFLRWFIHSSSINEKPSARYSNSPPCTPVTFWGCTGRNTIP